MARRPLVALFVVLLLVQVPVQAVVTLIDSDYVSETQAVGGNTLTRTVTAATGDAICACGIADSNSPTITISDDDTSGYTHLAQSNIGSISLRMACAVNVAASGGSVIVTGDFAVSTWRGLFVEVFRGVATSSAIEDSDGTSGSLGMAGNVATPALTLSGTGRISACVQYAAATTVTPASPLVSDQEDESWINVAGAMSHGPYSGSNVTPTWAIGAAADWLAQAFALLEAGGAPATNCTRLVIGVGKC